MARQEFEDRECSYRRGFQQGAYESVRQVEAGTDLTTVRNWALDDVYRWRIEAMRELAQGKTPKRLPPPRLAGCDGLTEKSTPSH
jgi:hypothetical protein